MKTLRVAICIVLIVGVLAMSLSVFAVDPTPEPTNPPYGTRIALQESMIAFYIYACLQSWGINIEIDDSFEFVEGTRDFIISYMWQYLAENFPSVYSISTFIAPWQAEYDYWGNLQFNEKMTDDIADFADWLIDKLNLVDNAEQRVDSIYQMGSIVVYKLPIVIYWINDNSQSVAYEVLTSDTDVYMAFFLNEAYDHSESLSVSYITEYTGYYQDSKVKHIWHIYGSDNVDTDSLYAVNDTNTLRFYPHRDVWEYSSSNGTNNTNRPDVTNFTVNDIGYIGPSDGQFWNRLFNNYNTINAVGGIGIVTNDLNTPSQDINYVEGDSLTIIDGQPNYNVIEWEGNVSVDNLPAIITQHNIPDIGNDEENPGFSVPWQAINGLIQYVAAPAGAIMALVNEAPVEGVIMLYALIGGMIIFGMIRIMREH